MKDALIKVVIFDFFDVIRQDAFHAWLDNHGYTRDDPPGDISRRLDKGLIGLEEFFEELAAFSNQSIDDLEKEFSNNRQFNDQLINYIHEIKGSYKIALLSNSSGPHLRSVLSEKGILDLFDELFISGEIGHAKPDPEIFTFALEKLSIAPEQSVFIDDQAVNTKAAKELGMHSIIYKNFIDFKDKLEKILKLS